MRITAELHCHTRFSDGIASTDTCIRTAACKSLQVLAITDHNTAAGALPYWREPFQQGVFIIPGEEVSTEVGHLLVLFVRETIFPGPFDKVVKAAREQEALVYAAHPYHIPLGNVIRKHSICKYTFNHLVQLDGIEVENGHNRAKANQLAHSLAAEAKWVGISGSDAHFPNEIGNACTELDVTKISFEEVYQALKSGTVRSLSRQWTGLPIYYWIGMCNRLRRQKYAWKEK